MSSLFGYDDRRCAPASVAAVPPAVRSTIAGTFCRMRWFVRYARGEAPLCRLPDPILLER